MLNIPNAPESLLTFLKVIEWAESGAKGAFLLSRPNLSIKSKKPPKPPKC